MKQKRIQLTLFVEENDSGIIEKIREEFNPQQYELIKSHVTLCREDELMQIDKVMVNLETLHNDYITIDFGSAIRFNEGKGVLIPSKGSSETFHQLRANLLKGIIEKPRIHEPHITLIHPKNAYCTNEIFEQIQQFELPCKLVFKKVSLIEQEIEKPWHILKEFELKHIANKR